jgi:predicted ATPase
MNSIVISGGPGSGKTTLLEALKEKGFNCSDEVSRQLIQEQVALDTDCLPWKNLASFADLALERMIFEFEKAALSSQYTFFDRGIPDIVAYLKVGQLEVSDRQQRALETYPYNPCVFMAPPWESIYVNDAERWQTFEEASELYHALAETYLSAGYQIIELPLCPVENRVKFILKKLKQAIPLQAYH